VIESVGTANRLPNCRVGPTFNQLRELAIMSKLSSNLAAVALASSFAIPAAAMPVAAPGLTRPAAQIQLAGYEQAWKPMKPWLTTNDDPHLAMRGDVEYYDGYRGYRYAREGYREYKGWWFPQAAFPDRAVTTGSIRRVNGKAHMDWCASHYETYRADDNTYAPPRGPRRECIAPTD
jgi:hypothetical protein